MGSSCSLFLFFTLFTTLQSPILAAKKSYVVYLGRHSYASEPSTTDLDRVTDAHHELLGSCMKSKEKAKQAIFYSYTRYINGFAAVLDDEEAAEISKHPEVVSVSRNQISQLHTTNSWGFLGLERNGEIPPDSMWLKARFGEDVIIGTLDTGVWPESESFNDEGMGPVPSKWKGYCDPIDGIKCNRKLIGARYFSKGYEAAETHDSSYHTARDYDGHGTHTLSTAGGRFVSGANLLGSGYGTAKGGSPNSRVASYKVCWSGCNDADVLAGYEAAIHDGVDILSVSLGSGPGEYITDGNLIGAFLAMENGILVVAAAGNEGPDPGMVGNVAPWILTVACSTISREFTSNVILGNNKQYKGVSFNTNTQPAGKFYPLINSVDAKAANVSSNQAKYCSIGSLDPLKVEGKIVYCTRNEDPDLEKSLVVAQAGGVGGILANQLIIQQPRPRAHFVPTSVVSAGDGLSILTYVYSTKSPVAYISGATEVGTVAAPVMADFSSPGPNFINPEILKPDITAPGVNILAAFTGASGPAAVGGDRRRVHFNIRSGTSMACPHVSGIAGLLKTIHPDWSPAAIKSAIMTTATTISNVKRPIANASLLEANPLNYGAGHIWPSLAMDPGLVYDLTTKDYVNFLCSIGYNSTQLSLFIGKPYICQSHNNGLLDFNYPSITVPNLSSKTTLSRTLKNVGTPSLYRVNIRAPGGISVNVEPRSLKFDKINKEKMFKVALEVKKGFKSNDYVFGEITWSDENHHVRSPVVVKKMAVAA
ncbi:PREDICTED: subtilisin-like protease SBT5.3 isoform X2 [Populus euphratica]|uniref:Subtilisin-like protease SBT5.3 isoform X2 n=1 Tax=Populus euphratica TaxID=75702 RepID=A0AAJ6U5W2_POPEU|nr:PREDICTED: subtilisin-like protease SBT5.3 isoform X2 [Populus euphratica]